MIYANLYLSPLGQRILGVAWPNLIRATEAKFKTSPGLHHVKIMRFTSQKAYEKADTILCKWRPSK